MRVLKLVATDLDGTLLHSDGTVTPRTRSVLGALEERGVAVVFVTGRPVRWMEQLWQHVGDHGLAVCSNGGIVYDVSAQAVNIARTIPTATVLEVARTLRAAVPGVAFALETTEHFAKEPTFQERYPPPPGSPTGVLEEIVDDNVVKLLARHEELDAEKFWAEVETHVAGLVTTTWSSVGALVEISGHGVTKATTLAILCERLGVTAEEVVAFGDMPNDLAMLSWAGRSYAMANAHPSVFGVADGVAPANDDDGVAGVLEKLFDL